MNEVKLLIGGRDCDAGDNGAFERLNPVTGHVASRAAAATLADADAACEAGRRRRVHRPALDHHPEQATSLSCITTEP